MRTCVRIVSIKGSSVARLEQALATRNPMLVRAAAAELRQVALPEALAICLLLLDAEPERYHAAAARWAGRFVVEHPGISVGEAQLVLSCLSALDGPEWLVAAEALSALCRSRRLLRAAELLEEWVERRIGG